MGVKAFHIGRIAVGEGNRPLVIPEIGINHGGSLTAAKEMADGWSSTRRTLWRTR